MSDDLIRYAPRSLMWHETQDGADSPYFFGSSLDFEDLIQDEHPAWLVPEGAIVPIDGRVGWSPVLEDPRAELCPFCLGAFNSVLGPVIRFDPSSAKLHSIELLDWDANEKRWVAKLPDRPEGCPLCWDRIQAGSLTYCPKCGGSGYERGLGKQRELAGEPPKEPPLRPPVRTTVQKSRRERRRGERESHVRMHQ